MAIEQIKVGFDNFTYVIYCKKTKKAAIVDPGFDAAYALKFISNKNLELKYIINTHYHSDHTSQNRQIKNLYPSVEIVASEADGSKLMPKPDLIVKDNFKIHVGNIKLKFLLTPGHTQGGICLIINDEAIITGDTLFIGDCGRTDLPGGNIEQMFNTLHYKIKILPDHLIVYPGHNYGDKPFDTLGNQKQTNKTLIAKNLKEFSKIE